MPVCMQPYDPSLPLNENASLRDVATRLILCNELRDMAWISLPVEWTVTRVSSCASRYVREIKKKKKWKKKKKKKREKTPRIDRR